MEGFDRALCTSVHGFTCYGQAVLQRFDRSAAAVQREFDVGRSEIAAARLKRAQHVDRRHRLGTAASPRRLGTAAASGARPTAAP